MLVVALCANVILVWTIYCVVTEKSIAISAACLALGATGLGLAARQIVREIDQPSTPTGGMAIRVYMGIGVVIGTATGIIVARNVFTTTAPVVVEIAGLLGAVLAFETGFIIACAGLVQMRRAGRRTA